MADLTPEQLERLVYLATVADDIDSRMNAYIASLGTGAESDMESFAMDGEVLRAVSLEFMESATALVEAARKLEKIRALLAVEDDGPEGSMGPKWLIGQIKEVLDGGT